MSQPLIEFHDLVAQRRRLGSRIDLAVSRVLEHGRFVLGSEVFRLEEQLQAFSGARHCITCANGTDALELALAALAVGPGDAVIIPAFSYVATAEAVVRVGATPMFADVETDSFNLCPASAEMAIKVARQMGLTVRCVLPVDLFGQAADYDAINALAHTYKLKVIADAAQSFGSSRNGRRVGTFADITTTSFYPSKPLGCYGDGGAIFTDDTALAEVLRSLRCHGQDVPGGPFARIGRNSRLDTIQAAILSEKLRVFEDEIEMRNVAADRYAERLPKAFRVPRIREGNTSVWAQYTVKLDKGRDEVVAACRASGIPLAVHYATPLHRQPAYTVFPRATPDLPGAEGLSMIVFSLPFHADLDEQTQNLVADRLDRTLASVQRKAHDAHA